MATRAVKKAPAVKTPGNTPTGTPVNTPVKKAVVRKVAAKKVALKDGAKVDAKDSTIKAPAVKVAAPLPKPAKAAKPAKPVKEIKPPKVKLVRDSFTMPADDWALIATLKDRALGFKRPTKKSELLRAGLQVLAAMPTSALEAALGKLQPLKPGRPKADKK